MSPKLPPDPHSRPRPGSDEPARLALPGELPDLQPPPWMDQQLRATAHEQARINAARAGAAESDNTRRASQQRPERSRWSSWMPLAGSLASIAVVILLVTAQPPADQGRIVDEPATAPASAPAAGKAGAEAAATRTGPANAASAETASSRSAPADPIKAASAARVTAQLPQTAARSEPDRSEPDRSEPARTVPDRTASGGASADVTAPAVAAPAVTAPAPDVAAPNRKVPERALSEQQAINDAKRAAESMRKAPGTFSAADSITADPAQPFIGHPPSSRSAQGASATPTPPARAERSMILRGAAPAQAPSQAPAPAPALPPLPATASAPAPAPAPAPGAAAKPAVGSTTTADSRSDTAAPVAAASPGAETPEQCTIELERLRRLADGPAGQRLFRQCDQRFPGQDWPRPVREWLQTLPPASSR